MNDITKELAETLKELRTKYDAKQHLGTSMVRVDAILDRYEDACETPEKSKMKINLKEYAGKLVVVTLRNEWMVVSLVNINEGYNCYPYSIDNKNYSNDGRVLSSKESPKEHPYDIVDIALADEDPEPVTTKCCYNDCGWCYAPSHLNNNAVNGACKNPKECPTLNFETRKPEMTRQIKRIQVRETERYYGDFEGTLMEIITSLQNAIDDGWEGINNEYERYEDYSSPYLYRHREENDKEYAKRMKELEKQKEQEVKQKDKRRREYERLKKEFEDTP